MAIARHEVRRNVEAVAKRQNGLALSAMRF